MLFEEGKGKFAKDTLVNGNHAGFGSGAPKLVKGEQAGELDFKENTNSIHAWVLSNGDATGKCI